MTLLEPTTTITDYLLAVLATGLAARLWTVGDGPRPTTRSWWSGVLFGLALAAALGGTSHGFADRLGPGLHRVLWTLTVWVIGATALALLAATVCATLRPPMRRIVLAAAVLQFLAYAVWMLRHADFIWVIADYLPTVLVATGLHAYSWRLGVPGAAALVVGLTMTVVGAGVQASGFALHPNFNHNDLYHVIQMAATVVLYRGAVLARDRQ